MIATSIFAFVTCVIITLLLIPLLASVARRIGLVDHPDKKRKLHLDAIPLVGGIAIATSSLITFLVTVYFFDLNLNTGTTRELTGLLIGSLIILSVGVIDDRFELRGRQKLSGQFIAASVLIYYGFQFDQVAFASIVIKFGIFSIPVVYVWILVAINSVNLLDGADGFAATIGVVIFLALATMGLYSGSIIDATTSMIFAGALLGFLRFNFPPAKVFLGDAGSMLIGFVLAAITIRSSFKQATAYAFFAPIALLAIPLIDTTAAILRRRLTGRSIYTTDRGHLHHAMAKKGLSPQASLIWVALLTMTTATGAIMSLITQHSEFAVISIGIVLTVLVSGRIFGAAEFELISKRLLGNVRSSLGANSKPNSKGVQLQGNRDWGGIWKQVCDFAEENGLNEIVLDVNAPWIHESFHAKRNLNKGKRAIGTEWQSELPLISHGRIFGRIVFWAPVESGQTHHDFMQQAVTFSAKIETAVAELCQEETPTKPRVPHDSNEQERDQAVELLETNKTTEP